MRDKNWNIERTTPTPPEKDTSVIEKQSLYIAGSTAALGFLSTEQIDAKILGEMQAPKYTADMNLHRFILEVLRQFPKALPPGYDLADIQARAKEHQCIHSYANVLTRHLRDVSAEARVRAVDLCQEGDDISAKILEASRLPGASADIVAAAAQIDRLQKEAKIREKIEEGRADRAREETVDLRARVAQQEQEIADLRRALSLRAAEPPPAPPSPPIGGGGNRNLPR
jgi:hypothetical protein